MTIAKCEPVANAKFSLSTSPRLDLELVSLTPGVSANHEKPPTYLKNTIPYEIAGISVISSLSCNAPKTCTDLDDGNGSEEVELRVVLFAAQTGESLLLPLVEPSIVARGIRGYDRGTGDITDNKS